MASYGQKKDGRWYCKYKTEDGWKWEYFGRGRSAEILSRKRSDSLNDTVAPPEMLFADVVQEYLNSRVSMSNDNLQKMIYRFENAINPHLGGMPISAVVKDVLRKYQLDRSTEWRMSRPDLRTGYIRELPPPSQSTIHTELTIIMAVLNFAEEEGIVSRNPAKRFKKGAPNCAIIQPPTSEEIDAILANASPHTVRAILISHFTGLRPGATELFCLTWDAVNFSGDEITITSAQKKGLPRRNVPLHPHLKSLLLGWYNDDLKHKIRFIIHYRGRRVLSINKSWSGAKKRAGITRRLRLYDCRHAFATRLLSSGADILDVSEMMGHSSPEITRRVYQHSSRSSKVTAINSIPVVTGNSGNSENNVVKIKKDKKQVVRR